jgi:hypothetical protein
VFFYLLLSFRALLLPSIRVVALVAAEDTPGVIPAVEGIQEDSLAAEDTPGVIPAVEGIREDTLAAEDTPGDILAVEDIQGGITTDTGPIIMEAGMAGGDTGTILVVFGGDLDTITIRAGGGPIHIPTTIPIHIPIMFLRRRSLSSLLRIANRSNLTTGTIARTLRATIHTSKVVREAGSR